MACSQKACVFPEVRDGLCAIHLRDRDEHGSRSRIYASGRVDAPFTPEPCKANGPSARKKVDWEAAQRDRNSQEFTLKQLAEKYGVSAVTICAHTRPSPYGRDNPNPKKKASGEQKSIRRPQAAPEDEHYTTSELRLRLETEKAALLEQISEIEKNLAALDIVIHLCDKFRRRKPKGDSQ